VQEFLYLILFKSTMLSNHREFEVLQTRARRTLTTATSSVSKYYNYSTYVLEESVQYPYVQISIGPIIAI